MLVLTRKVGEEIIVGGNILIQVVDINGGKVRIGVAAPRDITVDRMEVHQKRVMPQSTINLEESVDPKILARLEQIRPDVGRIVIPSRLDS